MDSVQNPNGPFVPIERFGANYATFKKFVQEMQIEQRFKIHLRN